MDQQLATYLLALDLVNQIGDALDRGYHYRDIGGRCLCELDQVVIAILENRLITLEKQKNEQPNHNGALAPTYALPA